MSDIGYSKEDILDRALAVQETIHDKIGELKELESKHQSAQIKLDKYYGDWLSEHLDDVKMTVIKEVAKSDSEYVSHSIRVNAIKRDISEVVREINMLENTVKLYSNMLR